MLRPALILLSLTSTHIFGETIKISAGKTYCKVYDIPSWGAGKDATGEPKYISDLEFRNQDSDRALYAAGSFSSNSGRSYGANKYSLDAASGKAILLAESQWQSATLVKRYIGSSWPVSGETFVSYAGRTFPRTGKYWAYYVDVGRGDLIAIPSWTGKPQYDDYGLLGLPLWALPLFLPSMIIDANRPNHWYAEIYDVANGQKLAGIVANSRGLGSHWVSYWLSSGQFIAQSSSMKHLVVCDFGQKPL